MNIDEIIKKITENGPDRVLVDRDGEAMPPGRVRMLPNGQRLLATMLVIWIRDDGWSLGCPKHLMLPGYLLFRGQWAALWMRGFQQPLVLDRASGEKQTLGAVQAAVEHLQHPPSQITMKRVPTPLGLPEGLTQGAERMWCAEASWGPGDAQISCYDHDWIGALLELGEALAIEEQARITTP